MCSVFSGCKNIHGTIHIKYKTQLSQNNHFKLGPSLFSIVTGVWKLPQFCRHVVFYSFHGSADEKHSNFIQCDTNSLLTWWDHSLDPSLTSAGLPRTWMSEKRAQKEKSAAALRKQVRLEVCPADFDLHAQLDLRRCWHRRTLLLLTDAVLKWLLIVFSDISGWERWQAAAG